MAEIVYWLLIINYCLLNINWLFFLFFILSYKFIVILDSFGALFALYIMKTSTKMYLPLQSTMGVISKVCLIMSGSSQTFFKYLRLVFTFVIKNEILYGLKKTENYKKWRRKRKMKNANCFSIYAMNFKCV